MGDEVEVVEEEVVADSIDRDLKVCRVINSGSFHPLDIFKTYFSFSNPY